MLNRPSLGTILICSLLISACASVGSRPKSEKVNQGSAVGERFFDANRAPASMSPPFDMGPEGLQIDPIYMRTKADFHFTLGESYAHEGNSNKAIEEYKLAAVYDANSAVIRLRLAVEYIKRGQISEAISHAEEALAKDPKYTEARLLLGGLYGAIKLYDKAEVQYRQTIADDPKAHEAYIYLGTMLSEQGKHREAIETIQVLTKDQDYENQHLAHFYLGKIHLENEDLKAAEASFQKSISLKANFVDATLALGSLYEGSGRRNRTIKLYESYQDKIGQHERIAEHLARFYMEDENYDAAYRQLEVVSAADPENLNARVKMALLLIEMKDYPRAIKRLKDILAAAPDSDKIRFFLGAVYGEVKDYTQAIEQFGRVESSSSYFQEAVVQMSYMQKLQGDMPAAIATIERGISLSPDHVPFYPLYASYLDDTKQYNKAVQMLKSATTRFPDNDQLHFFLGSMHDKVGDKTGTISAMKRTLEINPEHVQALNYLAYTYAELEQNLEEAYGLAKRALALKPEDAYIQDTVGWIYFKLGRYQDAARVLEAALSLKSDESVIAEHLGDTYYKLKLPQKAKLMYQRALKHETDAQNVEKIEAKITSIDQAERGVRVPASLSENQ